jgi:Sap, sulfolipid-1-addressing protein
MWGTVLVLAFMAAIDPVRTGITLLLISRPRPMLNLLAFWLGGMATGITAAVALLRLLRDFLPMVTREVTATVAIFTRAPAQIIIGVLMLLAALITAGRSARQPAGVTVPAGGPFAQVPQPSTPTVFCRLSARAQHVLGGEHLWVAFVAGLGSATNPVEYLLALGAIVASGAAIGTQISAAVMFTVVVLVVAEIPLVCYLATPAKTQAVTMQLHGWICAHRRPMSSCIAAVTGVFLLTTGVANI